MTILLKEIYTFCAIPIKIPTACIIETEKKKLMWNQKRLQIVEAILSKKNIGETALPDFKIHNCSKKNSMVLKRNRHVDQLDKIEVLVTTI